MSTWILYARGVGHRITPLLLLNRRGGDPLMTEYERRMGLHPPLRVKEEHENCCIAELVQLYPMPTLSKED